MKSYLLFFFSAFLCSCSGYRQSSLETPIEIYSSDDFSKKVVIIDTACINETKRAENDIALDRLVIRPYSSFMAPEFRAKYLELNIEHYIRPQLAQYNITLDTNAVMISDVVFPHDHFFVKNCYEGRMRTEIRKRHGGNFIDSITSKAEQQYVTDNPDRIFHLHEKDHIPKESKKEYEDFIDGTDTELKKSFVYPVGYLKKSGKKSSYTDVDFVLMKNGSVKDLIIESTFQNPENEKFRAYFEAEVAKFIKNVKWMHPTFSGLIRDCEMSYVFFHQ
ncbi:hypothetical protein [Flavobacterium sp.]